MSSLLKLVLKLSDMCELVLKHSLVSSSFLLRKTLIVFECCTVFSILGLHVSMT